MYFGRAFTNGLELWMFVRLQHGFARNMNWSIVDTENVDGSAIVTLELKDGPYSRSMWDFSFQARYKVSYFGSLI